MTARKLPIRAAPQRVYQLRIELQHIEPRIWRTVLVPETLSLTKLDRVVQAAMGWTNSHLHAWRIADRRYGVPDPDWDTPEGMLNERRYTVGSVLGDQVDRFIYDYDFGDGWKHFIVVEGRLAAEPGRNTWPMCIAGANACPPEDVGGPPGYMDFVQAMRDTAHEEHLQMWRWCGGPSTRTPSVSTTRTAPSGVCADRGRRITAAWVRRHRTRSGSAL